MPGGKQAGRADVVESLRQAREAGADAETSAETIAELMNSQPEAGETQAEDSDDGQEPDWGWDGEEEGTSEHIHELYSLLICMCPSPHCGCYCSPLRCGCYPTAA